MPSSADWDKMRPTPRQAAILETLTENTLKPDLLSEVKALRQEIKMLRDELIPVPSLILTGQSVLEEFKQLRMES